MFIMCIQKMKKNSESDIQKINKFYFEKNCTGPN